MPCLSNLYLCMPFLVPPSFPSPSSASPSSAPQQNFLYPQPFHQWHFQPTSCPSEMLFNVFNPPRKDNFASVHQHLHFYFKLGFQALPENSWWLMSLPELWPIWIGKCRYPETRNSGKCWFPGYFSVISKHDGKIDDWVLPVLLSLGLVPINRNTQNYS